MKSTLVSIVTLTGRAIVAALVIFVIVGNVFDFLSSDVYKGILPKRVAIFIDG